MPQPPSLSCNFDAQSHSTSIFSACYMAIGVVSM
ncbi:hypothetical protein BVRB_000360 [Beta vulgaris subsp. vulgaris]|uniref:Uncharacterized protein n=1 Tax=Beta vulgaris subsp. vulgaris TaxID=3555 RepID=A0A0J8B905_BETVV|nr:hypothetical protein BVRB_000360 [Beta vulgaris subsp. vulgaris]